MLESLIIIVHLVMALALVGLVLIQQGKGAEAGASFVRVLLRPYLAHKEPVAFWSDYRYTSRRFFATSLALAYYAKERSRGSDDLGLPSIQVEQVQKLKLQSRVVIFLSWKKLVQLLMRIFPWWSRRTETYRKPIKFCRGGGIGRHATLRW